MQQQIENKDLIWSLSVLSLYSYKSQLWLSFLCQESAYVWPADGDPAKIQTGVQRLDREGEEICLI